MPAPKLSSMPPVPALHFTAPFRIARRGAQTAVIALVIGLVIGYLQGRYRTAIVYSECIALLSWASIDFGRMLIRHDPRSGWPHDWRGPALMAGGCTFGYFAGTTLADTLLGLSSWTAKHLEPRSLVGSFAMSALIGATISMYYYLRGRTEFHMAQVARAERDASLARLALLQSQLEPHMLFNTLANLRVLIELDTQQATSMLDRLVAFLRATLSASRSTTQPLAQEFERVADYLALMAVRMGPRLATRSELPEALRGLQVPSLILQPLVENSIRHGLEPQVAGGLITISATAFGGDLWLDVRDTGIGLRDGNHAPADGGGRGGFGLVQVRERLATLYGDAARLELSSPDGDGTLARLTLPIAALQPVPPAPKHGDEESVTGAGR
jgi:hypothetical protein